MSLLARTAATLAAALLLAGPSAAVTFLDGSFEGGAFGGRIVRSGGLREVMPTSTPGGWLEYGTGVGYVDSSVWQASNGNRSLDLGALGTGGIVQRISGFTPGRTYRLSFDISANPFDPADRPLDKRVLVSASGMAPELFTYQLTEANTPDNMRYQRFVYEFQAVSGTQNVRFASLSPGSFGAVLDNVTLSSVPEVTTWALLITGFASVGVLSRRRRAQRRVIAA
jgi:hypothetical protein